jgi:glucose/mannose-6-phosphate isomerase
MQESIEKFGKQFEYIPEIINQNVQNEYKRFVIGGMGGSHLAGGILQMILPNVEIYIHRDYGIPETFVNSNSNNETLFIASSYSGNTEEVLDFADEVFSRGLNLVIS